MTAVVLTLSQSINVLTQFMKTGFKPAVIALTPVIVTGG
jgi:hypothetical protein